eukprot:GHVS01042269.1.p1 GENE.GHVS01042269.1~~GHVS01042269.1.p1  ORF type:complete len:462 (-),score=95.83 GHVS01042269.1:30-1334(-)
MAAFIQRLSSIRNNASRRLQFQPSQQQLLCCYSCIRNLHLHEYQSKDLLRKHNMKVQKGQVANNIHEVETISNKLKKEGAIDLILKCQVLAGGRGKGKLSSGLQGGVKVCSAAADVVKFAKDMLGYRLVTNQTNSNGEFVKQVLVHEGVNIVKELYLAIVLDRKVNGPAVVVSQMGGMDIEEVAEKDPSAVKVFPIDVMEGLTIEKAEKVAESLGFAVGRCRTDVAEEIRKLYDMFVECDATQIEINPFAVTDTGDVYCVDAKIQFDDNAAFRQKELFGMEDKDLVDKREEAATAAGLNFVAMEGNIGCLVNGAGLAMPTRDIIQLYGGKPANFLDVGGGSETHQIVDALKILQSDSQVKALFVNIFGGIMRCDKIALGLVEAAKLVAFDVPLVVRLRGNSVDVARQILQDSDVKCIVEDDFDEAAKKVCSLVV